ncbi:NAD-dependent epimerase/dehydratase family protein [Candidatus Nitrosotenuis aquarius]|uniref:NAD-dependent epimerase/dehydratase family protein n=1 Tax=Candidatus Nitrosotenuis aquarius TaxID=1846278 RepID=UPI000C1E7DA6|nr:GDP-mannose 4,6-dehydratase [Candidatus Nitrosotenuis aquarius]
MKILITGGLGFVGSSLSHSLVKKDHELILLTRNYAKKQNISEIAKDVILEKVDITNLPKFGSIIEKYKPNALIHLAGQTSHSKSFEDPMYDVDANTRSTLFILEKIRKMKLSCRFILGSTFVVVGKPNKLPVNEQTICNPTTIYGANRLTSEHYCKIYNNVYGLDSIIFRITNSFGPKEQVIPTKNAINYLIHEAFKGEKITIYNKGKFYRDVIYISDVISGIESIMKKGKSGNLYWISSNKKTWFYQIGKWLEDLTDTKVQYIDSPQYTKKVDVGNFVVDNSNLKGLGWKPKISVKDGIKKTLDYFSSLT